MLTTTYASGQILSKYTKLNRLVHGLHKTYYANGKRLAYTLYKEGERHGEQRRWYDNGDTLLALHFYQKGIEINEEAVAEYI